MLAMLSLFLLASYISVGAAKVPANCEVSITWNVSVVREITKGLDVRIVSKVCGHARRGKVHAILGPSGSGKTTLLNALAGKAMYAGLNKLSAKGIVRFSSESDPIFVEQKHLLFAQLTAREALDTSLALNSHWDSELVVSDQAAVVDSMLRVLGLTKVQDTKVGDAQTRGLSGGEKKRLAIGNEVISQARASAEGKNMYLFADEPTSGLDCFQARSVVYLLHKLAVRSNSTVIISIHEPRASICSLFDDVTLMSEGGVVYSGPAKSMSQYFSSQGFPCPASSSPFEYYLDLVTVDYSTADAVVSTRDTIWALIRAFAESTASAHAQVMNSMEDMQREAALRARNAQYNDRASEGSTPDTESNVVTKLYRHGILRVATYLRATVGHVQYSLRKFRTLYVRACRTVIRDRALSIARLASSLLSALLIGALYYPMGNSVSTVPDRLGLLQVAAVHTAVISLIKAATSFVRENRIVKKEISKGAYGVIPYFISKMCAEIPGSSVYQCLSAVLIYKLCGMNTAEGRLEKFVLILVMEATASSALGMSIGALVPTVEAGTAVAQIVMAVLVLFGGLCVVHTPTSLAWLPKISLIRWAYAALCMNEFAGLALQPLPDADNVGNRCNSNGDNPPPAWIRRRLYAYDVSRLYQLSASKVHTPLHEPPADTESQKVLSRMGFSGSTVRTTLLAQLAIILCNYVFTCAVLSRQKTCFHTSEAHANGRKFRLFKDDGSDGDFDAHGGGNSNSTMRANPGPSTSCGMDTGDGTAVTSAGAHTSKKTGGYSRSVFGFRVLFGGQVKPINDLGSMGSVL